MTMFNVSPTSSVGFWLGLDATLNLHLSLGVTFPGGTNAVIANLGAVGGLGAITAYPSAGYNNTTSATEKTGYVIKITDYDPVTSQPNRIRYFRVYIQSYQMSQTGGILGVTLKYQGPF